MQFRQHLEDIRQSRSEDPPQTFLVEPTKRAINELLFEIMPPKTTLDDVEDLALAIFATVQGAWQEATT